MKSNISGIYCIISKLNNKKYVGQSINIGRRWGEHLAALKKNKHHSQHLQNHFNKYGIEDLTFEVLEEVVDLNLLTDKEQYYMDLLKPDFNSCPIAGSSLGYKQPEAKNYFYNKNRDCYVTYCTYLGNYLVFSFHNTENEAIKEVEYIKTLSAKELLDYKKECVDRPKKLKRGAKNYSLKYGNFKNLKYPRFEVQFSINGKTKNFGSYKTEQEAIDRVKQVKLELGI